ncbi:MAG TPA: TAT-variant-translocated molybdopterin oxidoreductase [Opitutaceae bacterium]|nr:TAT-variant-translocated molybdopterin oxidoreductase [Opitutaceae bacterium]
MKRKFHHPEPSERELTGPKYWRSLDELADTPGFRAQLEREFPQGAAELDNGDRRHFLKIMAASFALGGIGLAGCRRPEANILPFGKSVENYIPGLPQYYATAMPLRKSAIPLLAETHQGRPTKIEGNPTYKPHGGASSLLAQASILDLYDPDRATAHTKGGSVLSIAAVNEVLSTINRAYAATRGTGLAFLAEESSSPTRARLITRLRASFPNAIWAEYEPVADEADPAAARAAFGREVKPLYRFARAKRIVSLDADFLQSEAGSLYYARSFSEGRRVTKKDDPMNRLYMAESGFTLTGSMADHRLRLASSHMLALAAALGQKITNSPQFAPLAEGLDFKDKDKWIAECAADLLANRGASLVLAGAHQPAQVHAIAYAINDFLGNIGQTVDFVTVPASTAATISTLAAALKAGSVKTLVVLGGNPAYNAPADLDWPALQKSVGEVVRFGYHVDETSSVNAAATTHIAAAHYLESWGDARTVDGTVVPVQPMILPLFGGLTEIEVLARIAGEANADPYALVSATLGTLPGGAAAGAMQKFLHDGLLENSSYEIRPANYNAASVRAFLAAPPKPAAFSRTNLEVRFVRDHKMDDGRFANNGWLQECPDPITKIAWDNAILISPKLAKELGIDHHGSAIQVARKEENEFSIGKENARLFELKVGGKSIIAPVHIQPGLSDFTLVVPLGYGRTKTGRVGTNAGFSAYPIRTAAAMHVTSGATLTDTGKRALLANTQEHWSMEGRDILREGNYEGKDGYRENPRFANEFGLETHTPSNYGDLTPEEVSKLPEAERKKITTQRAKEIPRGNSLYSTPKFDGLHQWGMSIDLNTCIGCNACVVACQAENNIPIVGKDQVLRGREMHWIRLDRYYSDGRADGGAFGGEGNRELPEDPQVSLQPMTCQHCELAPCETVCPVNATVHDDEGLNTMAYNRCIGTRYCANNCPYKVRRFNFFDFNQRNLDSLYMSQLGPKGMPELVKMVKNPEVSVRMRGVMEKCTYCVQRIQNGKIQYKVKTAQAGNPSDVIVPDGAIKTACQQTCPVDAIVFGNILDPNSAVMKAKGREQDYAVLGYLNVRPRTTYSAKLRNPNPKMPDYNPLPFSRTEYNNKNHPGGHDAHDGAGEHAPAPGHDQKKAPGHGALDAAKRLGGLS